MYELYIYIQRWGLVETEIRRSWDGYAVKGGKDEDPAIYTYVCESWILVCFSRGVWLRLLDNPAGFCYVNGIFDWD